MVTADERMKILQMLQDGKISPDAAAQLLETLDQDPPSAVSTPAPAKETQPVQMPLEPGAKARFLRVRVTDTDTGKPRVNVRLPVSLINLGVKIGSRYSPEIEGIDMASLLQAIQLGEPGPFVDVFDDEDGEHVEVFLE